MATQEFHSTPFDTIVDNLEMSLDMGLSDLISFNLERLHLHLQDLNTEQEILADCINLDRITELCAELALDEDTGEYSKQILDLIFSQEPNRIHELETHASTKLRDLNTPKSDLPRYRLFLAFLGNSKTKYGAPEQSPAAAF